MNTVKIKRLMRHITPQLYQRIVVDEKAIHLVADATRPDAVEEVATLERYVAQTNMQPILHITYDAEHLVVTITQRHNQ